MTTVTSPDAAPVSPELYARVAEAFERATKARARDTPEGPGAPWIAGQRRLLGALAVWRTARRLSGARWTDRFADSGVRVTAPAGAPTPAALDASAPCELTARALVTLASGQRQLVIGPRADRSLAEAALSPALERGVLELVESEALAIGTAALVITPYYYSPSDLDRLVWQVALEALEPCPTSEGGTTVMVPAGWDQRRQFQERVEARLGGSDAATGRVRFVTLDTDDCEGSLRAAASALKTLDRAPDGLAVFVYPMRREAPATERALTDLLREAPLTTINTRPSAVWAAGLGPLAGARRVEHHQLLHPVPSEAWTARRAQYERAPSLGGALSLATSGWLRALLR